MKKMEKTGFLILPFLALFAFSCVTEPPRKERRSDPVVVTQDPSVTVDLLDKKITDLEGLLREQGLQDEERSAIRKTWATYVRVRSTLTNQSPPDYPEAVQILIQALGDVDKRMPFKPEPEEKPLPEVISSLALKQKKILDSYLAEDYQGVISQCIELERVFGPDSLSPEIGLLFAFSLAKTGMTTEAINIAERVSRKLEVKPDLINLRTHIIQWHLALGQREKALEVYGKLIDDMAELEGVTKRASKMVQEWGTADRAGTSGGGSGPDGEKPPEGDPMSAFVRKVDDLIENHLFTEAKLLLIKQRLRAQEADEKEALDQVLKRVESAEETFQGEKEGKLPQSMEGLITTRRLIEEENYEGALAKLEELKGDGVVEPEMKELEDLATEKLIRRERNRAAKIFLQAKKTTELEKKAALLLSAHKTLKVLIERYPSSPLIDKLNNNMATVTKELAKLGQVPE